MRRWRSYALAAVLVAAFAYWVWPTPWAYHRATSIPPTITRHHRLFGTKQSLTDHGWVTVEP